MTFIYIEYIPDLEGINISTNVHYELCYILNPTLENSLRTSKSFDPDLFYKSYYFNSDYIKINEKDYIE